MANGVRVRVDGTRDDIFDRRARVRHPVSHQPADRIFPRLYDELYWNATGSELDLCESMLAEVRIRLPDAVPFAQTASLYRPP